jgi:DNA-binding MarR family transcriptional regulator
VATRSTGESRAEAISRCAELILDTVPRTMRLVRAEVRRDRPTGLTVLQLRALLFLQRRPGSSSSSLAEQLGISPPGCSALVERLVRAGHVERTTDPAERRRLQLHLTPAGEAIVTRARRRARAWLRGELAGLPDHELRELRQALVVLGQLRGSPSAGGQGR